MKSRKPEYRRFEEFGRGVAKPPKDFLKGFMKKGSISVKMEVDHRKALITDGTASDEFLKWDYRLKAPIATTEGGTMWPSTGTSSWPGWASGSPTITTTSTPLSVGSTIVGTGSVVGGIAMGSGWGTGSSSISRGYSWKTAWLPMLSDEERDMVMDAICREIVGAA